MKTWHQMIIGILLVVFVIIPVSADYPMFHADIQRTGLTAGDGPATDAELWNITTAEWADGSPVVADGRVYITTWPDMDFGDGEEMYLYCLDATTGAEIWKNPLGTGTGSVSGAAIADGKIFIGGTDNRLYCIDSAGGSTLWSEMVDSNSYFGLSCSPLVDGGLVMVTARSDGTFFAFTPEGALEWTFATGGGVSQFTSPAAAGGLVYFAGNDSTLFCVNPVAQSEEWNVTLDRTIMSTPVIGAGIVYVTTGETLYALCASDGSEVWNKNIDASFATPALDGNFLYAGAADGLYRFAADTGSPGWHFTSAKVDCSPVVANGIIYFATNEQTGKLYGVDAATGTEVWRYTLPSAGGGTYAAFYSSSPAVSDGVLYIGAENNHFYAFGEGAEAAPVEPEIIHDGSVTLTEGETFGFVPSNNESASYELDRTTDIGA
ncbi:MAG: PQQ-binding-like beta-propeller repeat protein, partial [Methanomicrobiaceae archaeon]|nr:PQQ-binding-like beta-propeller repeat protein [Methanomicrobiaceae archaeon]